MVRKRHPVVRGELSLAQFLELQHVLVDLSNEPGGIVDSELEKRRKRRRVALRVPSFLVVPLLVAESDFITTLPERFARKLAKVHPVRLLPPPLPLPRFEFALAWHARLEHDPAHTWLRHAIVQIAAKL
jgi:DNA-binding transcriptional LysR family regulator